MSWTRCAWLKSSVSILSGWRSTTRAPTAELFGTPDDCIERLLAFEYAGVRNVILSFSYGGMPDEHVRRSMQLFAREVRPALERQSIAA